MTCAFIEVTFSSQPFIRGIVAYQSVLNDGTFVPKFVDRSEGEIRAAGVHYPTLDDSIDIEAVKKAASRKLARDYEVLFADHQHLRFTSYSDFQDRTCADCGVALRCDDPRLNFEGATVVCRSDFQRRIAEMNLRIVGDEPFGKVGGPLTCADGTPLMWSL